MFFCCVIFIIRRCKIWLTSSKHSSSFASSCRYLYLLLVCVFCLVQLYHGSLCQKITFRYLICQKVYIRLCNQLPICLYYFQILDSHFLKPLTTPPIPLIWGNVCYFLDDCWYIVGITFNLNRWYWNICNTFILFYQPLYSCLLVLALAIALDHDLDLDILGLQLSQLLQKLFSPK